MLSSFSCVKRGKHSERNPARENRRRKGKEEELPITPAIEKNKTHRKKKSKNPSP